MEQSPVKILIVEDHRELLQFLGLAITMLGCKAVLASSGIEALQKLGSGSPDLILADLHLPGMDGFELTRILRKEPRHRGIPVIAMTTLNTRKVRWLCKEAGCDDCIAKPFSISQLRELITRLLGAHRLGRPAPCAEHAGEPAPGKLDYKRYDSIDELQAQKIKREGF
jgi:CheY-like chemotaxis protein